jgi:L-alanine-DL-glutamate epimerase-like enolase superfamily enzyme
VKNSHLTVPMEPGLGLEINPEFLKRNLADGEEYWG